MKRFARAAGAAGPATVRIPPRAKGDPTWVERTAWRTGESEVLLLSVHGGGHVISQTAYRPRRLLGGVATAIDGPAAAWDFFRRH